MTTDTKFRLLRAGSAYIDPKTELITDFTIVGPECLDDCRRVF